MESKIPQIKKSRRRKWLQRILISLAVIILLPIGLFTIGWLNRDTIINRFQDWYSENHTGTLTIEKVNANFLSGFPNVGFTLKNITLISTDTIADIHKKLHIDQVKLTIGAGNLLRGNIKFEKIAIKNANFSSEVISKRSFEYHEQLKQNKKQDKNKGFQLPDWLSENGASFFFYNVKYSSKDSILNKNFNLDIHKIEGSYKARDLKITGKTFFDVTVNNLGFNTEKGSFSNGARLTGNPKFKIDLQEDYIDIPDFPLRIDKQNFLLNAYFNLTESDSYVFNLKNDQTDLKAVKGLLTESLAVKVKNYEILKPFKSTVRIAGTFAHGNDPDIHATFSTKNNEVLISNKLDLKNASFSGQLTTDIYNTDSLRQAKKSSKDIKVSFDRIQGNLEEIEVDIQNAYYQSTPEISNFAEATILLKGENESLTKIIETENFDFKGGKFRLNTTISGDIPNPYQFLNVATGHFNLKNTQVILKKNGLQLPIESIDLELKREISYLKQLVVNLPNKKSLIFRGQLKNISGVLSKEPILPATSQILLDSENLNINEVIDLAKSFIPKSDADTNNRKTLFETLDAVYSQFHPQFNINVDTLQYKDYTINNLKSNITLTNSETILLENFDFSYFDALTTLKGNVTVHRPTSNLKNAISMNAETTSKGSIMIFKELFNINLFRIDSGDYEFKGQVNGNIKEFAELLQNARGDLTLTKTILYYEPAETEVVIDSLSLFVDNSNLLLKKFSLEVGEQYPLNLTGSIKQFPSFLLDDIEDLGSISLKVSAPYVDGDELLTSIKSFKKNKKISNDTTKKTLHRVFKDIYKFNPEIEIDIDSIKYNGLITEKIKAAIYFENDSILQLNHLDLSYKNTTVNIEGNVNAHSSKEDLKSGNPFDLDFFVNVKGKSEDLNDYLKTSKFIFTSGDFEFVGNYNAQSEDLDLMNSKTFGDLKISNTRIDYKAANLQIPIDSLHIEINDDLATLKTLDIKLPGKSSVDFSGSIDNFSEFINGSAENSIHSSTFSIESPYLDISDIKTFLRNSTLAANKSETKDLNLETYKQVLNDINNSFNPSIQIAIDTLSQNDIDFTKLGLNLYFDTDKNLVMEEAQIDFYGGSIMMNVDVGMNEDTNIPVKINMLAKDINIQELVTRFDYFNDDDLKNAEKIEGNINFNLDAIGTLDSKGKIDMNSLNGTLQMAISDLSIYNFKPIMDNSIMMKDERFENLQFRPIVQTFKIKDGVILIPQTEIQSSAIHLFVEGKMKIGEYIDVWLSLPWSNLKSNDGLTLPEKTSFTDAGSKFYVQLVQDKNSEKERKQKLHVKIRLSDRKLRKGKVIRE